MTSASNCPYPWVHNPDNVRISSWSDIPVKNVWKNENTGEILIQFSTITTVSKNKYVESHKNPETVSSRLRKLQDLISRGDVETELDSVTVTGGHHVAKERSHSSALQSALRYMERNS